MKHTVPHTLGIEMARKVARSAFEAYQTRFADYKPTTQWTSDDEASISFTIKGMALQGNVLVTASTIEMDLNVPFLLKPFQGTAVKVIDDEIKKWIEKAKRGEIA